MFKNNIRQFIVVVGVIAVLLVNGIANVLPLNGLTTGEISDRFQVFFVPAGYVFSIWGVIYLGLILHALYHILPSNRNNPRLKKTNLLFGLSCVANVVWLVLWHYLQFPLTILAMLALLLSLIGVYLGLGIGRLQVSNAERWLVHIPFSIYLGWVSVATIANATSVLDYIDWGGWGIQPQVWAIFMLVVGAVLAVAVGLTRKDLAYVLVFVWAFVGIAVKQAATPEVAILAWITAGFLLLVAIGLGVTRFRKRSYAPTILD
jgi:benzodiazapine receptor